MSTVTDHVELPITGMTCASCAGGVERRLNQLDGVRATVNYATEKAAVDFDPQAVAPGALIEAVRGAGYEAGLPAAPADDGRHAAPARAAADADELAPLRRRLIVSALLA